MALIGDEKNFISATVANNRLVLRRVESDKETVIENKRIGAPRKLHLRATVADGKDILFSFSTDGNRYLPLNDAAVDGFHLPPWDRAVRAALIAKGELRAKAVFDDFVIQSK